MDRWKGKVVVITGASSGIGLATAKALIDQGLIVIGLARRREQMENEMNNHNGPGQFHARTCDITKEQNVIDSLDWVRSTFGSLNILINNAGTVNHYKKIEDASSEELEHVINVNVLGLLYSSKHAVKIMRENQSEAHIVNINSVLGHTILPPPFPPMNVYPATKFAVRALSETLKNELIDSKIRVTNLSPGLVKTEMMDGFINSSPTKMNEIPAALESKDIANAILYILGAPPHVEINELTIQVKRM